MNSDFLKHYAPPGMSLRPEFLCFGFGIGASILYSMVFFSRYLQQRDALFSHYDPTHIIDGAVIDDFYVLIGLDGAYTNLLIGFLITAIIMLGMIPFHYAYYRQESRSIYLMKRLPDRFEIHKRALTLPILAVLCCATAAFLITVFYFAIYMLATPAVCIQPAQWGKLWGGLR